MITTECNKYTVSQYTQYSTHVLTFSASFIILFGLIIIWLYNCYHWLTCWNCIMIDTGNLMYAMIFTAKHKLLFNCLSEIYASSVGKSRHVVIAFYQTNFVIVVCMSKCTIWLVFFVGFKFHGFHEIFLCTKIAEFEVSD